MPGVPDEHEPTAVHSRRRRAGRSLENDHHKCDAPRSRSGIRAAGMSSKRVCVLVEMVLR